jgi:hypothetical protein
MWRLPDGGHVDLPVRDVDLESGKLQPAHLSQRPHRRLSSTRALPPAVLALSVLLCPAAVLCYGTRSDCGASITIVPPWVWPLRGLLRNVTA